MHLTYQNICIRVATIYDSEPLSSWWNNGKVMEHAGFPDGIHTTKEIVTSQLVHQRKENGIRRIIMQNDIATCEIVISILIEELFQQEYQTITLDSLLENTRAQHVYEQLGFIQSSLHKDVYTDAISNIHSGIDCVVTQDHLHGFLK